MLHPDRFAGQLAIITGAAGGIGRATTLRCAAEGARVAAIDREVDALDRVCAEVRAAGGVAQPFLVDLLDAAAIEAAVATIVADLGSPQVLANIAGIADTMQGTGIAEIDLARWNAVLASNLTAPFLLAKAVLPHMVAQGQGAIVSVSSLAGRWKSTTASAAYSASKAGLLGLTRHLATDYGPLGIRVNAICPGGVDTPMLRRGGASGTNDPQERELRRKRLEAYGFIMPIKRVSTPEEQAAAILFLASADASYINGVALDTNGGMYMA